MYANREGVEKDIGRAHMFYDLSAQAGDADGRQARDDIAEHITPEQIEEAQALAREWQEARPIEAS